VRTTFDPALPHATVFGDLRARYEQDGTLFDSLGEPVFEERPRTEYLIETSELDSAKTFLENILKNGALSKAQVYKTAESNNQPWELVKRAADAMELVKFTYAKTETWKLKA
jgi:hypothetical protein